MEESAGGVLSFLEDAQRELKERMPDVMGNFQGFSKAVLKEGLLSPKTKELIAVAVSVGIRCQP